VEADSPEEATSGILINRAEGGGQRFHLRARQIAVPFAVGAFPVEPPDPAAANMPDPGNGLPKEPAGPIEGGPHKEELDGETGEAPPLPDLAAPALARPIFFPA